MRTCSSHGSWRAVMLRGLSQACGGLEALVMLSADQYLRLPLPHADAAAWQPLVGQRVWADPDLGALRAEAPDQGKCGHA
jgi:hypothetical protein